MLSGGLFSFHKQNRPFGRALLFLRFLENHALAQRRVELHELDFARNQLLVFPRPDDMVGLGRLKANETVLRHTENLPESLSFRNLRNVVWCRLDKRHHYRKELIDANAV